MPHKYFRKPTELSVCVVRRDITDDIGKSSGDYVFVILTY